ncbi:hypothetical protein EC957_003566 [Mortierella hygrophila]|uniref:Uncharacterized protein n=1 Tax=Mortierella hygrophila TaxID=979708 RepID=A0A9P6K0W3_9FUNG|nr:hypothetical protein EC957_003566 [Mortierella hygrophila]
MVNATATANGIHLDQETRSKEIVASLRGFLKHQTERVSLYKEFNDAFKEYVAKRMTQEEYATICRIVTEGFVELSIEILALEAHLGGHAHASTINALAPPTTATATNDPSASSGQSTTNTNGIRSYSLDSPEHAQLIREVQLLEKQKLALTVQGQKWVLEKEAQVAQDIKDQEAELQADRVVGNDEEDGEGAEWIESDVQATAVHDAEGRTPPQGAPAAAANGGVKLTVEEWQAKVDENRDSLNGIVEEINDKLADIQEAIAVLVL